MSKEVPERKVIEAVFDRHTIKTYDSLADAKKQAPAYVVESYNVNGEVVWGTRNWGRMWRIHNLGSPGVGFTKGRWKCGPEFNTGFSYSPCCPAFKLIDPKGEIREFRSKSGNTVITEVFTQLDLYFTYESWAQYDLEVENKVLKEKVLLLEAATKELQEKLGAATSKLEKLNQ